MQREDERIVVIGSGPSGAAAARTLVDLGLPVTMLESGDRVPDGLLVRAMGRNVFRRRGSLPERPSGWIDTLVPGGLSNYWVGASPRFAPLDFHEGERLHERYRWPVSYAELVPYYETVERVLRLAGDPRDVPNLPGPVVLQRRRLPGAWQKVASAASGLGHGLAPMPYADGADWSISRTGVGFNSFTHIVRGLRRRSNFDLRLGAHALQLEWDGASRRVRSVIYRDRNMGCDKRISAASVVVAAGPLASTRLLLNSTSADFPDGLGNTQGLLGRYLHEHPTQWFSIRLRDRTLPRLAQAAYMTRGPVDDAGPLMAAGYTIGFSTTGDKLLSVLPLPLDRFGILVFGTTVPIESNSIELDRARPDECGLPVACIHMTYSAAELENLTAARVRLAMVFDTAGYPCSVPTDIPDPKPGASVHYGGTVRMHASPKYGMLNGWNRLHAVDNVVVADASAFTTGVEKNPTLTAMALATRAAERLAAEMKAA